MTWWNWLAVGAAVVSAVAAIGTIHYARRTRRAMLDAERYRDRLLRANGIDPAGGRG